MSKDDNIAIGASEANKTRAKERVLMVLKSTIKPVKYAELVRQVRYVTGLSQTYSERETRYAISDLILELHRIVNDGKDGYSLTNDDAKLRKMKERQEKYRKKFDEKIMAYEVMIAEILAEKSASLAKV